MLLPPPRPPDGAVARQALATLIILGLACVAYAVTGCAYSAPPEVLRVDVARVVHAKTKLVLRPGPDTVAGAIEAKAQLARDLWWYEPDAGAAAMDAGDAQP
jgi:hypothetical protein